MLKTTTLSYRYSLAFGLLLVQAACVGDAETPIELGVSEECNPLAVTTECLFPMPSRFFEREDVTSATGVRWNYKQDQLAMPNGDAPIVFDRYNQADGASPVMPILIHLGVDVDPAFLINQSNIKDSNTEGRLIHLIDLVTGEKLPIMVEMDANLREERHEGRFALIIRPMIPMKMGHRHAVVIEQGVEDVQGNDIPESLGFVALRDKLPTDNAMLEASRDDYESLFEQLAVYGYERDELYLAWDFAVASEEHILGPVQSMKAQALAYVEENGFNYEITEVQADFSEYMTRIVRGNYDVPCFLTEDNDIIKDADGIPQLQGTCTYPFTMGIPRVADEKGNLRFTLIGHGIFGEGDGYIADSRSAYERTHPLAAQSESVIIATNWIGLSRVDRDIIMSEAIADLNRLTVITDRLQQSLINNLILMELTIRALQHDPALQLLHTPLIGGEKVGYYGISLGGIQGTSLTSLSDRIDRAILAVPGGAWSTMLPRSYVYHPIKFLTDDFYPDPLVQLAFISFLQGLFDFTDPINLSEMLKTQDGGLKAKIILQEAVGDCQVPNLNTRLLARQVGVKQMVPMLEEVYGLEQTDVIDQGALVQYTVPDSLAEFTPPDEAVVPDTDNGTHSNATFSLPGFEQIVSLIRDNEIIQSCSGACDPD